MANFTRKANNHQDPNVNYNFSKEIAYWISKYNICPKEFRKVFDACGSISQALQHCMANSSVQSAIS